MKRLIPALLTLALLSACSSPAANSTGPVPTPSEPSAAVEPSGEPSLALPPVVEPTHHPEPEETHHVEPEPTHHPEPEETHHAEPEETHHAEPEPSHHPEPEETHHVEPEPTHHPEPEETHHGDSHHGAAGPTLSPGEPDLQAFYDELVFDDPDFNATAELFGEYLDVYYPGLSAIPTRQLVVYQPMMSAVVCEIALVEVEDSADIKAVIDLLQARVAAQVGTDDEPGGAWYPASIERWQNNSRIVSHGRYIMLIAYEKCDDVAAAFDALF